MNKKLIIRQVEPGDNLELAEMIRSVFIEHNAPQEGTVYSDPTTYNLYELFRTHGSVLWVATINGRIMGCCGIYPTDGLEKLTVELVKFYLPLEARGKGIGKQLIMQAIQSAIDFGYHKVYLESLPQFSRAIGIYEKLGFKMINHPLGKSGHTSCNVWMIKDLKGL